MNEQATLQTITQHLDRPHHELAALKGGLEAAFMQLTDEVSVFISRTRPFLSRLRCAGEASHDQTMDDALTQRASEAQQ
jgi:hypothetical protein